MLHRLRHLLIGNPLPTQLLGEKRLNKVRALAAFSPDALSSIAYANQEIYLGLVIAGSAGLALAWPIGMAITGVADHRRRLLLPNDPWLPGRRRILHRRPSRIWERCLDWSLQLLCLIDYMLTAAVSLTAAWTQSHRRFPVLWPHRLTIELVILV